MASTTSKSNGKGVEIAVPVPEVMPSEIVIALNGADQHLPLQINAKNSNPFYKGVQYFAFNGTDEEATEALSSLIAEYDGSELPRSSVTRTQPRKDKKTGKDVPNTGNHLTVTFVVPITLGNKDRPLSLKVNATYMNEKNRITCHMGATNPRTAEPVGESEGNPFAQS